MSKCGAAAMINEELQNKLMRTQREGSRTNEK